MIADDTIDRQRHIANSTLINRVASITANSVNKIILEYLSIASLSFSLNSLFLLSTGEFTKTIIPAANAIIIINSSFFGIPQMNVNTPRINKTDSK